VLSLAGLAGLTSCGGGGDGGGGGGHTGFPTTQANLTSANAPTFARFADLATRAGATMRLGEVLTGASSPFTDGGCFAIGAGQATVALNASSGPVSGTATYTNFDRCVSMRLNGTASVNGTMQPGNLVDLMNFTFSNLAFTAVSETINASGTAVLDWTSALGTASYLMTLNATASGAASFRLDNFRIDSQLAAGIENIFITGRLTTADGFVDIAVGPTRLELPIGPSSGLQNGQITMTGATTIATVTYNGAAAPTISIAPR
jgi:hypothetical protein